MLGLLAASQSACGDSTTQPIDGTGGDHGEGTGGKISDSAGGESPTGGTSPDQSGGAGGTNGDGGVGGSGAEVEGVTSSKIIPDLSLAEFTMMCDEVGGVVETHAHCGGFVTGRGFSYDSDIDTFTEHTCRGYNTCTGFSCVLDD